jgi:hypothetical protein
MEFFKIADVSTTEKAIQEKLTLGNLEEFVEEIQLFLEDLSNGIASFFS